MTNADPHPAPRPLRAYTVTLVFDDGMMATQAVVAPNIEMATAMMGVAAGKEAKGSLVNMAVAEIPAEWLRFALRAVESGKAGGDVVSLVSDNGDGRTLRCDKHKTVFRPGEECGLCVDAAAGSLVSDNLRLPSEPSADMAFGGWARTCPHHPHVELRGSAMCLECHPGLGGAA